MALLSIAKGVLFGFGSILGDIAMKIVTGLVSEKVIAKWVFKVLAKWVDDETTDWKDDLYNDAYEAYYKEKPKG